MKLSVRCGCDVQRTIDTDRAGPWRLRCKRCGDVLYDPTAKPLEALVEESREVEDSTFQRWLQGSGELKVLISSETGEATPCPAHPSRPVVAACTRCEALLCKFCLDRVGEAFVCSACVAAQAAGAEEGSGLRDWLRRVFGGS